MKTFMASPATIDRKWYVVDAEGKTLGRLASEVAKVLRGKNKPIFTPHIDTGDFMSFRIPIIPKFATVGKFSLPTFLQVVYLLPDVRQC